MKIQAESPSCMKSMNINIIPKKGVGIVINNKISDKCEVIFLDTKTFKEVLEKVNEEMKNE